MAVCCGGGGAGVLFRVARTLLVREEQAGDVSVSGVEFEGGFEDVGGGVDGEAQTLNSVVGT